jgi:hypothetical protein
MRWALGSVRATVSTAGRSASPSRGTKCGPKRSLVDTGILCVSIRSFRLLRWEHRVTIAAGFRVRTVFSRLLWVRKVSHLRRSEMGERLPRNGGPRGASPRYVRTQEGDVRMHRSQSEKSDPVHLLAPGTAQKPHEGVAPFANSGPGVI